MRVRIYFILFFLLLYSSFKAAELLPPQKGVAIFLTLGLFGLVLSGMIVYRTKPEALDNKWFRVLAWSSYLTMGFLGTFILLSLPLDLLHLLFLKFVSNQQLTAIVFATSLIFVVIGFFQATRGARVKAVDIPIENLARSLVGLKIAQISDLHVGPTIRAQYVKKVVERVNSTEPDLVFVTGDLVDGATEMLARDMAPLAELKSRYGIFYVTGNHEYYWQPASLIAKVKEFGFQPLLNANKILAVGSAKLLVAGVTDPMGTRILPGHAPDHIKALVTNEHVDLKIMLAHRPDDFEHYEKVGVDVQFSGHTHAGQFFPFSLLMPIAHTYYKGLNRFGRMWIYVNQGSGYWGPANRFATPTEITLATLSSR